MSSAVHTTRFLLCSLLLASLGALPGRAQPTVNTPPPKTPLRIDQLLRTPPLWTFELEQRSRFERLDNDFRIASLEAGDTDHQGLSLRTQLRSGLHLGRFLARGELQDARLIGADAKTPRNTGLENPLDILQAYIGADLKDALQPGAKGHVWLGRFTMDVGSRRLVARNRFRNTINAFTGLHLAWENPAKLSLQAFATLPVHRLPSTASDLRDHRLQMDTESFDRIFWGLEVGLPPFRFGERVSLLVLGLHERDDPMHASRNRQLYTFDARVDRGAQVERLDYELEAAIQVGSERASLAEDDRRDLAHLAYFSHLHLGYTFAGTLGARVVFQHDYASGDRDSGDGQSNRFDTLFGARRFEFGPTGLYGAFARSNLHSTGLRLEIQPDASLQACLAYRAAWLASARDRWTTAGLQGADDAVPFIGHQAEARVRYRPFPDNFVVEAGVAYLTLGSYVREARGQTQGNPLYVYTQITTKL